MLVVMQSHATDDQVRAVCDRIESLGLKAHPMPGASRTAIGITGNSGVVDLGRHVSELMKLGGGQEPGNTGGGNLGRKLIAAHGLMAPPCCRPPSYS